MKSKSFYLKLNYFSIFSIFMLFVLGGLVRATGSGMGCPDWPKCFGSYIPPTSADDLPEDYKEIFNNARLKKAERFAALLNKLGFKDKAQEILTYDALAEAHDFSASKAYTEYINRLWGALTGVVVLLTFIAGFQFLSQDKLAFVFTTLGFFGVMANALLGAVVVAANLWGNLVTWHFIAAFASIAFFMMARYRVTKPNLQTILSPSLKRQMVILLALISAQLIIGTQVREAYDVMEAQGHTLNTDTVSMLGKSFNWHRTLAVISLIFALVQFRGMKKHAIALGKYAQYLLILIVAQIVFGSLIVMTDWSAFSKLFHISIGAALFVIQFYICSFLIGGRTKPTN